MYDFICTDHGITTCAEFHEIKNPPQYVVLDPDGFGGNEPFRAKCTNKKTQIPFADASGSKSFTVISWVNLFIILIITMLTDNHS